jgi:hypothetical protein
MRLSGFETVSPEGWGLPLPTAASDGVLVDALGLDWEGVLATARGVGEFVLGLYDEEAGALHHYYAATSGRLGPLHNANFLMALNFVTLYDLFGQEEMLERAGRCFDWAAVNCCETHPMFFWRGGVRDGARPQDLWVKYTGDALWLALALERRRSDARRRPAIDMFDSFLRRAKENGFACTFDTNMFSWRSRGNVWHAFGFPITGYLELFEHTGKERYREEALAWGEHALGLQGPSGLFYLIDGEFWNSDLTAPELRGLVYLWELTSDERFLAAARRFADAVLALQNADGSWPLGVDRDGERSIDMVGPGDAPNIAMSLVRLHAASGETRYLESAARAVRYGLSLQAEEGRKYPLHLDDPHVRHGFWSWDPLYDATLSGDQSVHHLRGLLFVASYLAALGG